MREAARPVATGLRQLNYFKLMGTNLVPTRNKVCNSATGTHFGMTKNHEPQPGLGTKGFDKEPLPDKIGTSLKSLYDEVLNEDVPDDFLNLLRKADEKGASKKKGSDS